MTAPISVPSKSRIRRLLHEVKSCRYCSTPMQSGIATESTTVGSGDPDCQTVSLGGPGAYPEVVKCPACGWSVK